MLEVLCSEMELSEYGESVAVGEVVRRRGVRRRGSAFGTGLDEIEHWFDRYAGVVGAGEPLIIGGEIDAIAAISTTVTRAADGTWGPRRGSSRLEPLATTAATRRPLRRIRWESRAGHDGWWGQPDLREGDEQLWGWRFVLVDAWAQVAAVAPDASFGPGAPSLP